MVFRSPYKAINDITDDPVLLALAERLRDQASPGHVAEIIKEFQARLSMHTDRLNAEIADLEGRNEGGVA